MLKIDKKITGYAIKKETLEPTITAPVQTLLKRGDITQGKTYKIKPPAEDHAIYVTINSQDGLPIEMFINSQNTSHYQWVQTITRLVSAIFRKGGDVSFVAEEMGAICDPNGGYWGKDYAHNGKKKFYPSVIAEIGAVLKDYNRAEPIKEEKLEEAAEAQEYPSHAAKCAKCNEKSVVSIDGCPTCLNCGDSKCG